MSEGDMQPRKKRRTQIVSTKKDRAVVCEWMIEKWPEESQRPRLWKAVTYDHFKDRFGNEDKRNVLAKIGSWWPKRVAYTTDKSTSYVLGQAEKGVGRAIMVKKTLGGRGKKRTPMTEWLYERLNEEMRQRFVANTENSYEIVQEVALQILQNSTHATFNWNYEEPKAGKLVRYSSKIDYQFARRFSQTMNWVPRSKTGKPLLSEKEQRKVEQRVAAHLGKLKRGHDAGEWTDDDQYNFDETNCKFSMETNKTLAPRGAKQVQTMEVSGASHGFSIVIILKGGKDARIDKVFVIFQNDDCNYPIRGVPDNVDGITYFTAQKGFMTGTVMRDFLLSPRVWGDGGKRTLWCDNFSAHVAQEKLAASINTELKFYPSNSSHETQACDQFPFKIMKNKLTAFSTKYKNEQIEKNEFTSTGRVKKPSKHRFLQEIARITKEINADILEDGYSVARKAMIMTGLGTPDDGIWRVSMLSKGLQKIIKKYPQYFSGERLPDEDSIVGFSRPVTRNENSDKDGSTSDSETDEEPSTDSKTDTECSPDRTNTSGSESAEIGQQSHNGSNCKSQDNNEAKEQHEQNDVSQPQGQATKRKPLDLNKIAGPGFSDNVPVGTILALFDSLNRGSRESRDNHKFGDDMNLDQFRRLAREQFQEPLDLMELSSVVSARKTDADEMLADLRRSTPEFHSLNVGKLVRVVEIVARREGVKFLAYEPVEPTSGRGRTLGSVPVVSDDQIAVQAAHLPFHFVAVVITGLQLQKAQNAEEQDEIPALLLLNSLNRNEKPRKRGVDTINSPIVKDMCAAVSRYVYDVPCIQQHDGNSCGMASVINCAIALATDSSEALLKNSGITPALERFNLPYRGSWTTNDFVAATIEIVKLYELGKEEIPKLSILLRKVSMGIEKARKEKQSKKNRGRKRKQQTKAATGSQSKISSFFKART